VLCNASRRWKSFPSNHDLNVCPCLASVNSLGKSRVTPDAVLGALTALANLVLPIIVVGAFDKLQDTPRRLFADLVKMLSDHAVRATLVLVGVADSVEQLIAEHHSVERSLVQVRLPRMPPDETDNILQTGFGKLGMTITTPAAHRISKLAQGLPHYAHLLGLHAARVAIDGHRVVVSALIVDAAIDRAIAGSQQSIRSDYERAVLLPQQPLHFIGGQFERRVGTVRLPHLHDHVL
jgi:hypothetical protein